MIHMRNCSVFATPVLLTTFQGLLPRNIPLAEQKTAYLN